MKSKVLILIIIVFTVLCIYLIFHPLIILDLFD